MWFLPIFKTPFQALGKCHGGSDASSASHMHQYEVKLAVSRPYFSVLRNGIQSCFLDQPQSRTLRTVTEYSVLPWLYFHFLMSSPTEAKFFLVPRYFYHQLPVTNFSRFCLHPVFKFWSDLFPSHPNAQFVEKYSEHCQILTKYKVFYF